MHTRPGTAAAKVEWTRGKEQALVDRWCALAAEHRPHCHMVQQPPATPTTPRPRMPSSPPTSQPTTLCLADSRIQTHKRRHHHHPRAPTPARNSARTPPAPTTTPPPAHGQQHPHHTNPRTSCGRASRGRTEQESHAADMMRSTATSRRPHANATQHQITRQPTARHCAHHPRSRSSSGRMARHHQTRHGWATTTPPIGGPDCRCP